MSIQSLPAPSPTRKVHRALEIAQRLGAPAQLKEPSLNENHMLTKDGRKLLVECEEKLY